jgi:hypothetical protein
VISAYLLVLTGAVSVAASRLLPGARWVYRSPRLGLAAWYTVLAVVVVSTAVAAGSLVVMWPDARMTMCAWWGWCVQAMAGGHGAAGRLFGGAAAAVLAVIALRAGRAAWRLRRTFADRRREHAAMLATLGRESSRLGATVVDCAVPVAYVLPGRRGRAGRVVVSSGAVAALAPAELAAVLAHERAHAGGRHQLLADGVRLLAAAFPAVQVVAQARRQVDRLVELRADDVAASRHARADLARALVAMAEAGQGRTAGTAAVPAGAVAATGGDALERLRRLLDPPPALPLPSRVSLAAALVVLASAPALVTASVAMFPALAFCSLT